MREIILDGNNFDDLDSFYDEADRVLTKGLDWKTGHNLNAFNDLLRGGFGVHEYYEPFKLIWINFPKSQNDLSRDRTIAYYEKMLLTAHPANIDHIKTLLEDMVNGRGETLCDTILDIISRHEHIRLELK